MRRAGITTSSGSRSQPRAATRAKIPGLRTPRRCSQRAEDLFSLRDDLLHNVTGRLDLVDQAGRLADPHQAVVRVRLLERADLLPKLCTAAPQLRLAAEPALDKAGALQAHPRSRPVASAQRIRQRRHDGVGAVARDNRLFVGLL